jgi:hypothetical protein
MQCDTKTKEKAWALWCAVMVQFVLLPFDIASLILSQERKGDDICDNTDGGTNLNVSDYLLIKGIFGIIFSLCAGYLVYVLFTEGEIKLNWREGGVGLYCGAFFVFYFIWWIVGAVVLFRSNIECIKEGTDHVIYCLVMWCLFALWLLSVCCGGGGGSSAAAVA